VGLSRFSGDVLEFAEQHHRIGLVDCVVKRHGK
jgi:hypothetical protein